MAEESICPFLGDGLETYGMIALGTIALGIFSVFSGNFFKKTKVADELKVSSVS